MMKGVIYAGSFDPLTKGHLWMIQEASRIFDSVHVVVANNPQKQPAYSDQIRKRWIVQATTDFQGVYTSIESADYLVRLARILDIDFILRGIRNQQDYTYEHAMRNVNADLDAGITSVFLMPPRELAEVSSSFVRSLIGFNDWTNVIQKYVPKNVAESLKMLHSKDGERTRTLHGEGKNNLKGWTE